MFRAVLILATVVVAYAVPADVELYSDKYDYINIDELLANDNLREQYYDCFMDKAPCVTPDAKFFKGNFAETIATKCLKCTEKQKVMFEKVVEWYTVNQPEKWKVLFAKFLEDAKAAKIATSA